MKPTFWKLSLGKDHFDFNELLESIEERLVYVHKNTPAKAQSGKPQGESFIKAQVGDYFYLTHGNTGIYLIGQFTGPANFFTKYADGWVDRPFRIIKKSINKNKYNGPDKWWAPNHNSTFIEVPKDQLKEFENEILLPYFDLKLSKYGIKA